MAHPTILIKSQYSAAWSTFGKTARATHTKKKTGIQPISQEGELVASRQVERSIFSNLKAVLALENMCP